MEIQRQSALWYIVLYEDVRFHLIKGAFGWKLETNSGKTIRWFDGKFSKGDVKRAITEKPCCLR